VATADATVLTENEQLAGINADYEQRYGFHDAENYLYKAPKGLSREIVEKISEFKSEPQWMREVRLKALHHLLARKQPTWGSPLLAELDYDNIRYFVRASETPSRSWDDVPEDVKRTFDRLGIPEAERKFLSGVGAQYESEVVYHQIHEDLEKQGVIFTDMDTALREHEEVVRQYFATVIPPNDNKLAALNSAVWSGGSFVYVPEGVHVEMPLQAYFRINTENMGQFERTLIIAEPGSYGHYVEGCTAPTYSSDSLHSAVVELVALPGARIRYTTVQNWSTNVYNLVTKRAVAYADATVEWVDCNLGSKLTMKYPSIYLLGERACRSRSQRPASTRTLGPRSFTPRRTRPRTSLRSRSARTGASGPTGDCSRSRRAPTAPGPRSSATRCCSTSIRAQTPTQRSGSARTTSTSVMRRPSRRSATSSSSI
jgi:Fe-S cluster assembly protein SufB